MDNNTEQPTSLGNAELRDIDVEALSDFSDVDVTQLRGFGSSAESGAESGAEASAGSGAEASASASAQPASGIDSEDDVSSSDSESEDDAAGTVLLYDIRPKAQVYVSNFIPTNGMNPHAEASYLYPVGKGLPWMQLARSKGGVLCDECGEHYGINKEMKGDVDWCLCTKCLHDQEDGGLEDKCLKDVDYTSYTESKKPAFVFSLTSGYEPISFEFNTTHRIKMGKVDYLYGSGVPKEYKYPGNDRYWLFYFDGLDKNTQAQEMLSVPVRSRIPRDPEVAKLHREDNYLILRITVKEKETGEKTVIEERSGPIKIGAKRFQNYGDKFHAFDLPQDEDTQELQLRRRKQAMSEKSALEMHIQVLQQRLEHQISTRKASEQELSNVSDHEKTRRIIELQERLDKTQKKIVKLEAAYLEKVHENSDLQHTKNAALVNRNRKQKETIDRLQKQVKAYRIQHERDEERHEQLVQQHESDMKRVDRLAEIQERVNMRFRHEFKLTEDQWNRLVKIHQEEFEAERQERRQAERQAQRKKRKQKRKSTQQKKRSK